VNARGLAWLAMVGTSGVLLGCNGEDPICDTNVLQQYPEDGATDVFFRSAIEATLAREEPDASFTLVDASGAEVAGSLARVGSRITFTPDAPLTPGESYTSTLNWSCSESKPVANTFSVGDAGTAPVDAATLIDRTWIADLKAGRAVAPFGIGSALDALVEAQVLLAVDGQSGGTLQFSSGAADYNDVQDLCSDTSVFDASADYSADPYFVVEEPEILMVILGDRLNIRNLTLSGSWDQGGSTITGLRLDGILDTRDLKEELGASDDLGVCNLFAGTYGVQCEECPDGIGPFCMRLIIDGLTLVEAGYDMLPVTLEEVEKNPDCAAP
jgi:hypothetical protein